LTSSDDETGKEANSFHLSRLEHTAQALYYRCNRKFEVNARGQFYQLSGAAPGEAEHDS